jgi:signal peptidase I
LTIPTPDPWPDSIEEDHGDLILGDTQPIKTGRLRRYLREVLETIILAVALFLIINAVTARIRVDGNSMEPSFHHGNYVIVNKLAYRWGEISRGDVIVFPSPENHDEDLIKRVIGLPGDRVWVKNGIVYVNEVPLDEPYIQAPMASDLREVVVPEGRVYVMGDNRNNSSDSRRWGPLEIEVILGKAVFVYWPALDFGLVEHFVYPIDGDS